MKYLIVFVLAFLPLLVNAQLTTPDGKLNTSCADAPRVPPLPVPPPPRLPPGLPKQLNGAVCTEALVTADLKGGATGWWCPKTAPENAQLALYAVTWNAITLPMLVDFARLGLPFTDRAALLVEMQTKYQSLDIRDMCDVWHPLVDRLNAIYPAPLPLPQTGWKATGATIFKFSNGRLTGPTIRKATKDAACDGVTVVAAGTLTYQGLVGGAADEKTPCTKP